MRLLITLVFIASILLLNNCKDANELEVKEFQFSGSFNNSNFSLSEFRLGISRDTNQITGKLQYRVSSNIEDTFVQGDYISFFFIFEENISFDKVNDLRDYNLATQENNNVFYYVSGEYDDQYFVSTFGSNSDDVIIINKVSRVVDEFPNYYDESLETGDALALEGELKITDNNIIVEGNFTLKLVEIYD